MRDTPNRQKTLPGGSTVKWIGRELKQKILNHHDRDGYVTGHLWREYHVFPGGLAGLYRDAFLREHLAVQTSRAGLERAPTDLDARFIRSESVFPTQLIVWGGWENSHRHMKTVVWCRAEGES